MITPQVLLQEGVFNTIGKDFTIFIKESNNDGLKNIFIHDTRDSEKPSTLIAKKGKIINTPNATKIFLEEWFSAISIKRTKTFNPLF